MDEEQEIEDPAMENEACEDNAIEADEPEMHEAPEDTDDLAEEIDEEICEDADDADDVDSESVPANEVAAVVEAILFSTDSPLPIAKITTTAELPTRSVKQAIKTLNARYEQQGAAFRIEEIAGGFQMMTMPEYNDVLRRLLSVKKDSRLSQASMETLAIIAYRQPILRADVEAIRGVATGDILRGLMDKNLVKIVGRADVIGRPMLYGTTKKFLEVFGLARLEDLPRVDELRSGEKAAPPKKAKSSDENEEESETGENGESAEENSEPADEQAVAAAEDQTDDQADDLDAEELEDQDEDFDDEDFDDEDEEDEDGEFDEDEDDR